MTPAELTGQVDRHIVHLTAPVCALHRDAVTPFAQLRRAALADGFDVVPVSSFRPFARQLALWNSKFAGERPLLDAAGQPLDTLMLSEVERVAAILAWSALPGASRHHWGTDVDLIDRAAVPDGYRVQLVAEEFSDGGPFASLAGWLETHALRFGFFRPYRGMRSAVQAEPWHYSFAPLAESARRGLTLELLRQALAAAAIQGKTIVMQSLPNLHARYVEAIDWP